LTKILIDAQAFDPLGFFNPAKNGFVVPNGAAGLYVVMVTGYWEAHGTGGTVRQLEIQSGSFTIGGDTKPSVVGGAMWMSTFCSAAFNVGDVITVHAIQNSGGNLRFHAAALLMYSP
jgi:hypothetical protein